MGKKVGSVMMLTLLLIISMLTLACNVQPVKADWTWTETIYIRADGTVDPDTAPISTVDNITYTLTDNIIGDVPSGSSAIDVERNNIVVDGAGYTVQGTGTWSKGIYLLGRSNVTIKNTNIKDFEYGVEFNSTFHSILSSNNITSNVEGVKLYFSSINALYGNSIEANERFGVHLWESSNNIISGNEIAATRGYTDSKGVFLEKSSNNVIDGNTVIGNDYGGIVLLGSSNNIISANEARDNSDWAYGIELTYCSVWQSCYPTRYSDNNTIIGNNITRNGGGILLQASQYNTVVENNVIKSTAIGGAGIRLELEASNNKIYHNNFINNTNQVRTSNSVNIWDDGYPSGGNCWSNYTGTDQYSGSGQDQLGSDGIGDTPYIIGADNQDRYPLINPWTPSWTPSEYEPVTPTPPEVQVGVRAGDWMKCYYTVTGWPSGTLYPEWLKVEILSVEGTTATVQVTMHMSNGTEQSDTVNVNVVAGGGTFDTLSGFLIPANCSTGDSIIMGGAGFTFAATIDGETTRTYAGASRTVVYASFSQYGTQLSYYWDKKTGVMVEASTTSGSMTATAKATETNMWQAQPFGLPIDATVLYALITVAIVIVAALAFFMIRRRKKLPKEIEPPKS